MRLQICENLRTASVNPAIYCCCFLFFFCQKGLHLFPSFKRFPFFPKPNAISTNFTSLNMTNSISFLFYFGKFLTPAIRLPVSVISSVARGGGGLSLSPNGLSTKMQNNKNNTFLALLRLFFALKWTKK